MVQELQFQPFSEYILIYYHSGDCSICYNNLLSLSSEFPELLILSITPCKNQILVNYYLDKINFYGLSICDSNNVFLTMNQNTLIKNNLFLIDSCHNILASSIDLSNKFKDQVNYLKINKLK